MKILISRCLLGESCRYDGKSKPVAAVEQLRERGHELIPVCPEVLGGLPTPRPPAEIQSDGRVFNRKGVDVTVNYQKGAERTLEIAREQGCTLALLKEKSPSCGNHQIYDGSFTGTLISGKGVAVGLLEAHGIRVLGESQIDKLLNE